MIPHQQPLAGQLLAFRRFAQYALIHVETACLGADWLLLAEGHLTRRLFGDILRRIWALPVPGRIAGDR